MLKKSLSKHGRSNHGLSKNEVQSLAEFVISVPGPTNTLEEDLDNGWLQSAVRPVQTSTGFQCSLCTDTTYFCGKESSYNQHRKLHHGAAKVEAQKCLVQSLGVYNSFRYFGVQEPTPPVNEIRGSQSVLPILVEALAGSEDSNQVTQVQEDPRFLSQFMAQTRWDHALADINLSELYDSFSFLYMKDHLYEQAIEYFVETSKLISKTSYPVRVNLMKR